LSLDDRRVADSFEYDPDELAALRGRWLGLLDRAVWDELSAEKLGTLPRLRKRLLELGEHLRSVTSDKGWIPQSRERVKSATAACLNLRECLLNLERAAKHLSKTPEVQAFELEFMEFRRLLLRFVERHEGRWCELLESQYDSKPDG